MNEEPNLITSVKSQPVSSGGKTVYIDIYRMDNEDEWALAIDDEFGNTSIWDETFQTEGIALAEAKKTILKKGIVEFIGPEDGKGKWK